MAIAAAYAMQKLSFLFFGFIVAFLASSQSGVGIYELHLLKNLFYENVYLILQHFQKYNYYLFYKSLIYHQNILKANH